MLTHIRYPVAFTANPPTTDRVKTAILSYENRFDAPEISPAEARQVIVNADPARQFDTELAMMEYDGRLFRPVCEAWDVATSYATTKPFEPKNKRSIPLVPRRNVIEPPRGVGIGVTNRIMHRLFIEAAGPTKEDYAWPPGPHANSRSDGAERNNFLFEKYSHHMGEIDNTEFQAALAVVEKESKRLLWIGNRLWIETPPLCLVVERNINSRSTPRIDIGLACLPEWLDQNVMRQYFPMSQMAEAFAFAEELRSAKDVVLPILLDRLVNTLTVDHDDLELFDFDPIRYKMARSVGLIGGDIARWLVKDPVLEGAVDAELKNAVGEVVAGVRSLGWDHREWAPMEQHAATIFDGWKAIGLKPGWTERPAKKADLIDGFLNRAIAELDQLDIRLTVPTHHLPGPR